jgi:rRNA maturation protein Nop10
MCSLEGKCPKCGAACWGWALADPLKQKCEKCGSTLEILENGVPRKLSEKYLLPETPKIRDAGEK